MVVKRGNTTCSQTLLQVDVNKQLIDIFLRTIMKPGLIMESIERFVNEICQLTSTDLLVRSPVCLLVFSRAVECCFALCAALQIAICVVAYLCTGGTLQFCSLVFFFPSFFLDEAEALALIYSMRCAKTLTIRPLSAFPRRYTHRELAWSQGDAFVLRHQGTTPLAAYLIFIER